MFVVRSPRQNTTKPQRGGIGCSPQTMALLRSLNESCGAWVLQIGRSSGARPAGRFSLRFLRFLLFNFRSGSLIVPFVSFCGFLAAFWLAVVPFRK